MDLNYIKETLEDRFTIFTSEESVKQYIKEMGYTWITKNNKDVVTKNIQDYVTSEIKDRLEALQRDIEQTVNNSFQNDIEIYSFIEETSDSWGLIIGGGSVALLTFLIEGAVFWPLTIISAIGGFIMGREKMTNELAKNVYISSKNICQRLCEKISPILDELICKKNSMEIEKKVVNTEIENKNEGEKLIHNNNDLKIYVNSPTYGKGTIVSIEGNFINVNFNQIVKKFAFPDAFKKINGRSFLDITEDYENTVNIMQYLSSKDLLPLFPDIKPMEFCEEVTVSYLQECVYRFRLLEYLEKKGFLGFMHTTNFDNFKKIYSSNKMLSRTRLNDLNVDFHDCAEGDIIEGTSGNVKDHNRFYFRSKTPTNYRAYKHCGQKNPVIFVLKKECIFDKSAIFFDGNARAKNSKYTESAKVALTFFNWDCIFSRVIAYECEETDEFLRLNKCSLSELKRMQNAEFLFKNEITLDMFETMYFSSITDYVNAISLFGRDPRFIFAPEMFK